MMQEEAGQLGWTDFLKVEMRVGTILSAQEFKDAGTPAYKILIDFGEHGTKKTSAQLTKLYDTETLIGKQVIAVVNFPPKQIANIMSECLILATLGENNDFTLLTPERKVENGLRIG